MFYILVVLKKIYGFGVILIVLIFFIFCFCVCGEGVIGCG